jgi:hypothetical protein
VFGELAGRVSIVLIHVCEPAVSTRVDYVTRLRD